MSILPEFVRDYLEGAKKREAVGIPPLPLNAEQTRNLCSLLQKEDLDPSLLTLKDCPNTVESLLFLLAERVSPGVTDASYVKADFLGNIVHGKLESPHISAGEAITLLGKMGGGANIPHLVEALFPGGEIAHLAQKALSGLILIPPETLARLATEARGGSPAATDLLKSWAEGWWFDPERSLPDRMTFVVCRTTGEINTDFLSPAQEAGTRDDIPLHALTMLSNSPHDQDFLVRLRALREKHPGVPFLFAGDVLGTGSSRKSASNSLVWWIGSDIPHTPNKRRGGVVMASKIAPIFFNTLRGCGTVPIRCQTGALKEGDLVKVDFSRGTVVDSDEGNVLARFNIEPSSIEDEYRAGGRNLLIIGRKLTHMAGQYCRELGITYRMPDLNLPRLPEMAPDQPFSLAQKLVGRAAGLPGAPPGAYVEPKAHLVFSQDTTGRMTRQELEELACTRFVSAFVQSFCHTAAGPKSRDSLAQNTLTQFVGRLGGIALKPGDGIIHTLGNRFCLPYFVGTGADSHTRFPIGISFAAGSDLVAFAASQGYFPLDMPESVHVRFHGVVQPGITVRDFAHAIPHAALKEGKLNLEKGDAKVNVFADRILEIEGLDGLSVEDSYKLTNTSAERSAAAATFTHSPEKVREYVFNNLAFLRDDLVHRNPSIQVDAVIELMEKWLADPEIIKADEEALYADRIKIDLGTLAEPLLAAPNDPDRIVTLSEAAGTRVDEVFVGSCMADITDFRFLAIVLEDRQIPHNLRLWAVPPDRECALALANEGLLQTIIQAGGNIHVPGCSLCMGNQAQVATGATVFSTSTRNFDNRLGEKSRVYLGSSFVAALTAILGKIPTLEEYMGIYFDKVRQRENAVSEPLRF